MKFNSLKMMNINDLPPEILNYIFKKGKLGVKEVCNCTMVCKWWKRNIDTNPVLYEMVFEGTENDIRLLCANENSLRRVKYRNISNVHFFICPHNIKYAVIGYDCLCLKYLNTFRLFLEFPSLKYIDMTKFLMQKNWRYWGLEKNNMVYRIHRS